ncbi:MAG: 23S rRNA (guanosine(2251)-2'-O)-methyltransferase RlmB [Pseudomonadota bacterium]
MAKRKSGKGAKFRGDKTPKAWAGKAGDKKIGANPARVPRDQAPSARRSPTRPTPSANPLSSVTGLWVFGRHPVLAALANPARDLSGLLATKEAAIALDKSLTGASRQRAIPLIQRSSREEIAEALPAGAVHQGLALLTRPLDQPSLEAFLTDNPPQSGDRAETRDLILLLDQVTDPHNVGAILRSAAAFGAKAVVTPQNHAASESGTLAKSASGALEHIPYIQVPNLARALDRMKTAGYWSIGLAGEADQTLAEADPGGPLVVLLGAEGTGLRRLTRQHCDLLAALPTRGPINSLNVSNAAAVALYALTHLPAGPS